MAKGIRNKWKRKMNAIKRIRYGEKEKIRLENMLKASAESEAAGDPGFKVINFKSQVPAKMEEETPQVEEMDTGKVARVIDPKTKRDQFGNYAPWINQRKMRVLKQKGKKQKKSIKKNKLNKKRV